MYAYNNSTIRWDTAESERVNFVDGNVRPSSFQKGKSDEARTYRLKLGFDVFSPEWKKGIFPEEDSSDDSGLFIQSALIPPLKHVGFPAHIVKHISLASAIPYQDKAIYTFAYIKIARR